MPICMTWEQFAPPHNLNTSPAPRFVEYMSLKIKPLGYGEPFCVEPYRVHRGVFSNDATRNETLEQRHDSAMVVTHKTKTVAVLSGILFWVHEDHRRNKVSIDIAAEMSLARAVQGGLIRKFEYLEGTLVPMTAPAIAASKRAYLLAIQRGLLAQPEGYQLP